MEKINDIELKKIIFQHQMRLLSKNVIATYTGNRFALKPDSEMTYKTSQHQFMRTCRVLTHYMYTFNRITESHLKKRIKALIDSGDLASVNKDKYSVFMLDNDMAKEAYQYARAFWESWGLVSEPVHFADMEKRQAQLESTLMHRFKV